MFLYCLWFTPMSLGNRKLKWLEESKVPGSGVDSAANAESTILLTEGSRERFIPLVVCFPCPLTADPGFIPMFPSRKRKLWHWWHLLLSLKRGKFSRARQQGRLRALLPRHSVAVLDGALCADPVCLGTTGFILAFQYQECLPDTETSENAPLPLSFGGKGCHCHVRGTVPLVVYYLGWVSCCLKPS